MHGAPATMIPKELHDHLHANGACSRFDPGRPGCDQALQPLIFESALALAVTNRPLPAIGCQSRSFLHILSKAYEISLPCPRPWTISGNAHGQCFLRHSRRKAWPIGNHSDICRGYRQNFSMGKRASSPASFAFEGFKKVFNTFPQIIRHVAKISLFHADRPIKIMPDIL